MLQTILLQAATASCTFGGINSNNWILISALVLIFSLMVAGLVYLLSNFVGRRNAEKLHGYVRFEIGQVMISAFIIIIIASLAALGCNVGMQLTSPPQQPLQFAQSYVGQLLFVQGVGLESSLYSTSIQLGVYGGVVDAIASPTFTAIGGAVGSLGSAASTLLKVPSLPSFLTIKPQPPNFQTVYNNYTKIIDVYITAIIVGFAMLFLQFILIPLISAGALTVVVPIAIIMRGLSFVGPRLRESANAFLAIAIAFYFVYPMAFVLNQTIINWMYSSPTPALCTNVQDTSTCNFNPYPQYIADYKGTTLNPGKIFSQSSAPIYVGGQPLSLPSDFYFTSGSQLLNSLTGSANNPLNPLLYGAQTIITEADQVSKYLFESVVLIALDMAITMGFAVGLYKGLNGALSFLGSESIFS